MPDDLYSPTPPAASPRRRPRTRTITIAGVAAAGLITGGVVATTVGTSDAATPSSSPSSSSGKPAPGKGNRPPAPSANDIDGTVTAASSDSLTVRTPFGSSRTYKVTSDTTVHRGRSKVAVSSLESGQRVHVRGTKSGSTYTATDVDVHAAHIDGVVAALADDSATITDNEGFTRTVALASGTTYTKDGSKGSRSDLKTGSVVHTEGSVASDGTTLDATSVDILTKQPTPPGPGGHGPAGGPAGGPPAPPAGGPGKGAPGNGKAPTKPSNAPSGAPSGSASKSGS